MFAGILALLLIIIANLIRKWKRNGSQLPKGFKQLANNKKITMPDDVTKDRFLMSKLPENIDCIIIGSGISGLTAGSLLSKAGKKVLILEQHYVAGGNLHVFFENGYEFDTGYHYVNFSENSIHKNLLDLLCSKPIKWSQLGHEDPDTLIYDKLVFGSDSFEFHSGIKSLKSNLITKFPEEEKAIMNYFKLLKKSSTYISLFFVLKIVASKFLSALLAKFVMFFGKRFFKNSVDETLSSLTQNKKLKTVLCTQFGDYGLPPTEAPFFIHSAIASHYLKGAHYPEGGSLEIAKRLIETIYQNEGRVLVGKRVKKIILGENKDAIGVEMESGEVIGCPQIISSVGMINTFENLMPRGVSKINVDEIKSKVKSESHLVLLFIGFNQSVEKLKLPSKNLWVFPSENYEEWWPKFKEEPLTNPGIYMITFGSAKDPTWSSRFPNKSTGIVITFIKRKLFEKWENQKVRHRDVEYKNLKEKIKQKILNESLLKHFPHLKENIDYCELGTPLSCEHFLGAYNGSVYGLDNTRERFSELFDVLRAKTDIRGLFLTGQDITTPGIVSNLFSGLITSYHVLGYGNIWDLLTGRDLIRDLLYQKSLERNIRK